MALARAEGSLALKGTTGTRPLTARALPLRDGGLWCGGCGAALTPGPPAQADRREQHCARTRSSCAPPHSLWNGRGAGLAPEQPVPRLERCARPRTASRYGTGTGAGAAGDRCFAPSRVAGCWPSGRATSPWLMRRYQPNQPLRRPEHSHRAVAVFYRGLCRFTDAARPSDGVLHPVRHVCLRLRRVQPCPNYISG